MSSQPPYEAFEAAIAALAAPTGDALEKADDEGYPNWEEAAGWTERAMRLVLHERDPEVLAHAIPELARGLVALLVRVRTPEGFDAAEVSREFVTRLPRVRAALAEDVEAAFEGDPAAKSFAEIIVAYPSIFAISIYRLAHVLVELGVPQIPRIMSEHAHARTGVDIHPGATIGRRFFIDHGTGVVIGESSEIGNDVRLYHGVTLGAFSPRRGQTIKGTKRHPTLGDDVTIYPGATILGGDTVIGSGSVVNGNAYVTESVPPGSRVVPEAPRHEVRQRGGKRKAEQVDWDI
jgi:serine O-acetyltransferase